MPIDRVLLIGAGGHAMVVLDALESSAKGKCTISAFDESPERIGQKILNVTIQHFSADMAIAGEQFHISIGNNQTRERLFKKMAEAGGLSRTVIHPVASIAASATIGTGTFIAARAIIAPSASIGRGCIINHGAIVDHECAVGSFCHLAPGSTLAGNVKIGAGVLIGAGANILPGVQIGDGATIGAGAVVIADVPPGATHVGVPAREIH